MPFAAPDPDGSGKSEPQPFGSVALRMGEDVSARFRRRACECREIAAEVQEDDWRDTLLTLAQDLEDEADLIDEESAF